MARLKTAPKVFLALMGAGAVFGGVWWANSQGYFGRPGGGKSTVPQAAELQDIKDAPTSGAVVKLPPPSVEPAKSGPPTIKIMHYAWNAHRGLIYANGGSRTTKGSIMDVAGVDLALQREDMNDKLQAAVMSAAKATKSGQHFGDGSPCITLMGDGTPAFLSGANSELAKINPDSTLAVIGTFGFSRGEDRFMGRSWWKATPKLAQGALIAGVLRDGDWNIAVKWAADNGIKNNPDERTWDPDALNWYATDDYIKAAEAYVSGTETEKDPVSGQVLPTGVCVDRPVVRDGAPTGEKKHVCVNGVVTWTPGDVTVAKKKGGLASIVSTKEYRSQMPCTLLCVRAWANNNRPTVEALLSAAFQGAEQVRSFPEAARKSAEFSAALYKEETADYWDTYAKGTVETDKYGIQVPLGGSAVNNLNDNLNLFGLTPGSVNVFAATYTVFGNILTQQYPKLYPSYPEINSVLDLSFLKNVAAKAPKSAPADLPKFTAGAEIKETVSKRTWAIEFATGTSTITPESNRVLDELANGALVADELAIGIYGHTDNTGDPEGNRALSLRRANAVKTWLMKKSTSKFPEERFSVNGFGQDKPIASNSSEVGRKKNRRVEIILGVQ